MTCLREHPPECLACNSTVLPGTDGIDYTLLQALSASHSQSTQEVDMLDVLKARDFQESKIEEEPILGKVLVLKGGRVQPLTGLEKLLLALRLTDAKRLERKYERDVAHA